MRFAFRREWTLDCNWKVYVDNYLEGYHIPIVHPGLMKELDYGAYRTETFRNHVAAGLADQGSEDRPRCVPAPRPTRPRTGGSGRTSC